MRDKHATARGNHDDGSPGTFLRAQLSRGNSHPFQSPTLPVALFPRKSGGQQQGATPNIGELPTLHLTLTLAHVLPTALFPRMFPRMISDNPWFQKPNEEFINKAWHRPFQTEWLRHCQTNLASPLPRPVCATNKGPPGARPCLWCCSSEQVFGTKQHEFEKYTHNPGVPKALGKPLPTIASTKNLKNILVMTRTPIRQRLGNMGGRGWTTTASTMLVSCWDKLCHLTEIWDGVGATLRSQQSSYISGSQCASRGHWSKTPVPYAMLRCHPAIGHVFCQSWK